MVYVEAPNTTESIKKSIFLAGGITGCNDWQSDLKDKIKDIDIIIYNPRRKNFPIDDPKAAEAQITWEYQMLRKADAISFWFCPETMQPIVLFELGSWVVSDKPILVGVDPKYQRKQDVEIQTKLARPGLKIASSLDELSDQIFKLFNEIKLV